MSVDERPGPNSSHQHDWVEGRCWKCGREFAHEGDCSEGDCSDRRGYSDARLELMRAIVNLVSWIVLVGGVLLITKGCLHWK